MQNDLSKMSVAELRKLNKTVSKEIESKSSQAKKLLLKEVKRLCAQEGIELSELVGVEKPAQATVKVKKPASTPKVKKTLSPLYFNQVDPSRTWSGRGRTPEWVRTWLDNGGDLDALKKKPS